MTKRNYLNWPTEESWRPARVSGKTVPVVQRRGPVVGEEETVTRILTVRAASPVVKTTAETSGRGLGQNGTAVFECGSSHSTYV